MCPTAGHPLVPGARGWWFGKWCCSVPWSLCRGTLLPACLPPASSTALLVTWAAVSPGGVRCPEQCAFPPRRDQERWPTATGRASPPTAPARPLVVEPWVTVPSLLGLGCVGLRGCGQHSPRAAATPWGGGCCAGCPLSCPAPDCPALSCSLHGLRDPGVLCQHRLRRLILLHQWDPGNRLPWHREQQAQAG